MQSPEALSAAKQIGASWKIIGYDEQQAAAAIDSAFQMHDPLVQRLEAIERVGDAVIRWICTVTFTLCGAAALAAYAAQYLLGH